MSQRLFRFAKLTIVAVFFGYLANGFGNFIWYITQMNHPAFPSMTKHLIAALLEPTTSKLLPAIAGVAYVRHHDTMLIEYIDTYTVRLAVLFGFLAGFLEFALYLLKGTLLSLLVPLALIEVIQCRAPPVLLHTVTGTLVALPIFSLIKYRPGDSLDFDIPILSDQLFFTLAVGTILFLLAQFVHVWWNTGGNDTFSQIIGLTC